MEGSVDVFDGEDARTLAGFEVGSAEKVVVTISLKILVPADEDDVIGGNPKTAPFVKLRKYASTPFRQGVVSLSLPHHHWTGPLFKFGHSQSLDHVWFVTGNRNHNKQL